jgi:hypothetical protein
MGARWIHYARQHCATFDYNSYHYAGEGVARLCPLLKNVRKVRLIVDLPTHPPPTIQTTLALLEGVDNLDELITHLTGHSALQSIDLHVRTHNVSPLKPEITQQGLNWTKDYLRALQHIPDKIALAIQLEGFYVDGARWYSVNHGSPGFINKLIPLCLKPTREAKYVHNLIAGPHSEYFTVTMGLYDEWLKLRAWVYSAFHTRI